MNRFNESPLRIADTKQARFPLAKSPVYEPNSEKWEHFSLEELAREYYLTGSKNAFSELYRRTRVLVLACAVKILKEEQLALDISSEVYSRLMLKLRETLPLNFKPWLYAVTRNQCLEWLRRERRQPFFDSLDSEIEMVAEVTEEKDSNFFQEEVRRAIQGLTPKQVTCIELFFLSGMRYKEIAEETGFSLKEVKSHIQNGKRKLRHLLKPTWDQFLLQA